jgi:hypothetical protein
MVFGSPADRWENDYKFGDVMLSPIQFRRIGPGPILKRNMVSAMEALGCPHRSVLPLREEPRNRRPFGDIWTGRSSAMRFLRSRCRNAPFNCEFWHFWGLLDAVPRPMPRISHTLRNSAAAERLPAFKFSIALSILSKVCAKP